MSTMLLISKTTGYMQVVDKRYVAFTAGTDRPFSWFSVSHLNKAIEQMNKKTTGAMFDNTSKAMGEHWDRQYNIERTEKGIQFGCQMLPWSAVDKIIDWLGKQGVELVSIIH